MTIIEINGAEFEIDSFGQIHNIESIQEVESIIDLEEGIDWKNSDGMIVAHGKVYKIKNSDNREWDAVSENTGTGEIYLCNFDSEMALNEL